MFYDEEYIDDSVEELIKNIESGRFETNKSNNFIDESDLEDDFSQNEISEAQQMFFEKAKEYLIKNHKGKYAMWVDWCVHVTTVAFYRDMMKECNEREDYIKLRESIDII